MPKPSRLSFEEAAAIPVAGITALQALRDHGAVAAGQRVLINGAAGGVGTFAVQIAKALGAHVAGVCSTRNVELVRSLGADDVVDYTSDDFAHRGERYDVVLDCVGNRSFRDLSRTVAPGGILVIVGGGGGKLFGPLTQLAGALVRSRLGRTRVTGMFAKIRHADLDALRTLVEEGTLTPVLDRTYALADVADAFRHVETGHARGKVVVSI